MADYLLATRMPRLDLDSFLDHVADEFDLGPGQRIVVGVSGGVDSVVLLRMLHEAGFATTVCHVNYGLRGEASDADAAFVERLAKDLGVPIRIKRAEQLKSGNLQEWAREVRYGFFRDVAEADQAELVAVGHHQDDHVETVLLNLFRGTGPRGLAGISPARSIAPGSPVTLIRPLLAWSREEIDVLARERDWSWRDDASNATDGYRRNWLRNRVLPLIEQEYGEGVGRRIARTAERIGVLVNAFDRSVPSRWQVAELCGLSETERHQRYMSALKQYAPEAPQRESAVAEIDELLEAQPGRRIIWPGVTVWREADVLVFQPEAAVEQQEASHARLGETVETPWGALAIVPLATIPSSLETSDRHVEVVDRAALKEPLLLRPWRYGDRFKPLGLKGTKLVSDLLTDARVPPSERRRQLVLTAGGQIIWLIGHRIADDVRITEATGSAVRLTWRAASDFQLD